MYAAGLSKEVSEKQFFLIRKTIQCLIGPVLNEVFEMIKILFHKHIPDELVQMQGRINKLDEKLLTKFCQIKSFNIVQEKIDWEDTYPKYPTNSVSKGFINIIIYLSKLGNHLKGEINNEKDEVLRHIVKYMVELLTEDNSMVWQKIDDLVYAKTNNLPLAIDTKFEKKHIEQFLLDLHFFQKVLQNLNIISVEVSILNTDHINTIRTLLY